MCSKFTTFNLFNRLSQRDETEKSVAQCGKMGGKKKEEIWLKRLSFCLLFPYFYNLSGQTCNCLSQLIYYVCILQLCIVEGHKLLGLFTYYTTVSFSFDGFIFKLHKKSTHTHTVSLQKTNYSFNSIHNRIITTLGREGINSESHILTRCSLNSSFSCVKSSVCF